MVGDVLHMLVNIAPGLQVLAICPKIILDIFLDVDVFHGVDELRDAAISRISRKSSSAWKFRSI